MSVCPAVLLALLSLTALQVWSQDSSVDVNAALQPTDPVLIKKQVKQVTRGAEEAADQKPTILAGAVGGGNYAHTGAGVNPLCMPVDPVYDDHPNVTTVTYLFGGEYQTHPESTYNKDLVCAVCRSPYLTTIMIPVQNTCPAGWTLQYHGYLMTGYANHKAASEFHCVDDKMGTDYSSYRNDDGYLFYYVTGYCGSLPCPLYSNPNAWTCVVCSK